MLICKEETTPLPSELEAAHFQSTSLRGEVEGLGRLREELIDGVEKLHAEKHKLEVRVAEAKQHAQVGEGWGEGRGGGGEGNGVRFIIMYIALCQ